MPAPSFDPSAAPSSRSLRGPIVFTVLSYALAWAAAAPLWVGGQGLEHPQSKMFIGLMMFAPAIAAFVVLRFLDRPESIPRATGMTPLRPVRTLLRYCAYGLLIPALVTVGGLALAAVAGAYQPDLADFSGFRAFADSLVPVDTDGRGVPLGALGLFVALQLGGLVLGLPMMFGEEWGWRGYLLPALLPLGTWPAVLLHGVIWGVWHAPVILLGYNFGRPDLVGLGAMAVYCVLVGVILAWLRLASGSIWPAVIAHGANNSASALIVVFSDADSGLGRTLALPTGVWVAIGAVALAVIAAGIRPRGARTRDGGPLARR